MGISRVGVGSNLLGLSPRVKNFSTAVTKHAGQPQASIQTFFKLGPHLALAPPWALRFCVAVFVCFFFFQIMYLFINYMYFSPRNGTVRTGGGILLPFGSLVVVQVHVEANHLRRLSVYD